MGLRKNQITVEELRNMFEEYDTFYDDYVENNSGTLVTNCHIFWGLSLSLAYHWYGIY